MQLLRDLPTNPLPNPTKTNKSETIRRDLRDLFQDNVIAVDYLEKRAFFGVEKYGQPLMTFDGRDTFQETFEELVDAANYSTKGLREHATLDGPTNPHEQKWFLQVADASAVLVRQGMVAFQYAEEEEAYLCAKSLHALNESDRPMVWAQSFCKAFHGNIVGGKCLNLETIAVWFKRAQEVM